MNQYIRPNHGGSNFSIAHNFKIIYNKIEFILYIFLCLSLFISSRLENKFLQDVENLFLEISLPVANAITFPFDATISVIYDFKELAIAKKENQKLQAEIDQLKSFYVRALNIYEENQELRRVLSFVSTKSSEFKAARIIGKSKQIFSQKIFINIGKNRGIQEGNIVVGNSAILGRVEKVFDDKSRVLLLNDVRSRIPVITSKARVREILSGNNSDLLEILYLPKNHDIKIGDMVFTSGDGDTLAPGHLVGVVDKVTKESAFVIMADNINSSEIVTVVGYGSPNPNSDL